MKDKTDGGLMQFKTESEAKRYCKKYGLTTREIYSRSAKYIAIALAKAFEDGLEKSKNIKWNEDYETYEHVHNNGYVEIFKDGFDVRMYAKANNLKFNE